MSFHELVHDAVLPKPKMARLQKIDVQVVPSIAFSAAAFSLLAGSLLLDCFEAL